MLGIIALIVLSGCGTMITVSSANKEGENIGLYSGTRLDLGTPFLAGHGKFYPMILDTPFSFIADTLMLPYVIFQGKQVESTCKGKVYGILGRYEEYELKLKTSRDELKGITLRLNENDRACAFTAYKSDTDNSIWEVDTDSVQIKLKQYWNKGPDLPSVRIRKISAGYSVDFSGAKFTECNANSSGRPKIIELHKGSDECVLPGSPKYQI